MTNPFSARVKVVPDVVFRLVGDESVLLNLNTGQYLGLNASGTRMWNVLTAASSIQTAYDALLQEYDVEPARLHADLVAFLDQLRDTHLIET
jgi:Coenzyme PQQ synthesis protein D (PqqD)